MTPKTIVGRYTVERVVGHGGMGSVWLCRDEVLGRQVAVKQVGRMPGETVSDVNRALREARSSAALNHPHVVSVYDAVEDGDHNWLVMEYVPSRTLGELLAEEGRITPERAAWIGAQAADGLAAAHARGTVHRDVKPGNILVTDDDYVKITDFGISRTQGDPQLTHTGLITGTPAYFAPETARGEEPGLPADVWALGATLYAAVEGHPPYADQGNAIVLLTTIATTSAPLPRQAGLLTEAINRMMDRDPDARWTMAQAARVLRELPLDDAATTRSDATVMLPAAAAGALGAGAGEDTGATGAGGGGDVRTPAEPTPLPEPRPEPRPDTDDDPRRRAWLIPLAAAVLLALIVVAALQLLGGGDDDDQAPAAGQTEAARSPGAGRTTSPAAPAPSTPAPSEEAPSEEPPAPVPEPEEPEEESPAPSGDVEAFGTQYYGLLPSNTEAAYALLSPSYGSSFEAYDGFWRTIEAVDVRDVTAVDDTTVDVSITYTTNGGATEDETRRLFLEPTDDGYVIVDDAAV